LKYFLAKRELEIHHGNGELSKVTLPVGITFYDYLEDVMGYELNKNETGNGSCIARSISLIFCIFLDKLPFMFHGGLIGYFGYQMKTESLPRCEEKTVDSSVPDAVFFIVHRLIVFDHHEKGKLSLVWMLFPNISSLALYLVTTSEPGQSEEAYKWREEMKVFLESFPTLNPPNYIPSRFENEPPAFSLQSSYWKYIGE
jgi:anthranilate/para-aminobenzoate synthase component I